MTSDVRDDDEEHHLREPENVFPDPNIRDGIQPPDKKDLEEYLNKILPTMNIHAIQLDQIIRQLSEKYGINMEFSREYINQHIERYRTTIKEEQLPEMNTSFKEYIKTLIDSLLQDDNELTFRKFYANLQENFQVSLEPIRSDIKKYFRKQIRKRSRS